MRYSEMLEELDRIEAECGCELTALQNYSPFARAKRILECDDPPKGLDLELVRHVKGGKIEEESHWIA